MREAREIDEIRARSVESMDYRALDLVVDTAQRLVFLCGQPVHLRPRTFDLLQFLIENRQRLVDKNEIFAEVWKDAAVTDATLVGCVQEIRKALGDDAKSPRYVRTVPRRGYQFIAPVAPVLSDVPEAPAPPATPPPARRLPSLWIVVAVLLVGLAAYLIARSPSHREPPYWEAAWFRLDSTPVVDSSGNLRDVRASGRIGTTVGAMGAALIFDGLSGVVEAADPARVLPTGDAPRTFTVWIRTDTSGVDDSVILNLNSAGLSEHSSDNFALILTKTGRVAFVRHGRADLFVRKEAAVSAERVDDGKWHFIAGRFAGAPSNLGSIFVDGVEGASASMPLTGPLPAIDPRLALGNGLARGTFFRGAIDDARVFARALPPAAIAALHRCTLGQDDVKIAGKDGYYFTAAASPSPDGPAAIRFGEVIEQTGTSFAGGHITRRAEGCALRGIRAADVGQDLYVSVDLLAPSGPAGLETQAGPFFRSRRGAPGDGIIGGTSAGFWIRLHSTGVVSVRRLNPSATIAFTEPAAGFDASVFHKLEFAAKGASLRAALDGKTLTFDQGGTKRVDIAIEPVWERSPGAGVNAGTAGIYFAAEGNNSQIGGQKARNLRIEPFRPLLQ